MAASKANSLILRPLHSVHPLAQISHGLGMAWRSLYYPIVRSRTGTALFDQFDRLRDGLFDSELTGIEQDCVRRLSQRRDLAAGVPFVTSANIQKHVLVVGRHPAAEEFADAAVGADFR